MAKRNIDKAKEAKKDEFYTQLDDINNELNTVLSFKTIPIILVILRKTIIFAHSDA